MNRNPSRHDIMTAAATGCFDALRPKFFDCADNAAVNAHVRAVVHSKALFNRDSPNGQIDNNLSGMNVYVVIQCRVAGAGVAFHEGKVENKLLTNLRETGNPLEAGNDD